MKNTKQKFLSIVRNTLALLLLLWIVLGAFPTGWLYDLGVQTGAKQGEMPDSSVQALKAQADIEDFFFQDMPATVSGDHLIQCPLMRLRDTGFAGEHTNARKRTVVISEYRSLSHPPSFLDKIINLFAASASYNSYYLAPLEDGTYICVYFDDYLLLRSDRTLPTGYIRYSTAEEQNMLRIMAKDYTINPVYVLDMYRHGKVSWIADTCLRVFIFILPALVYLTFTQWIRKKKP